ncbi:MAG: hypothetical protein HYR92_00575 [Burkholderiales bacterium]|nr:hypothetical protein [Burkholderiales bacterium]
MSFQSYSLMHSLMFCFQFAREFGSSLQENDYFIIGVAVITRPQEFFDDG